MIYPSADTIEEKVGSRYSLVVLAAKRAKQIKEGAPVLIDTQSTNPLTVALEEIAAGKVTITEAADVVPQPQKTAGDGEPRPLDPALDLPTLDTETRALEDNAEDALDAEAAAA